ncbi:MAG: hypothetical protein ACREUQ_08455, partial [Burkholderiales bacterium]
PRAIIDDIVAGCHAKYHIEVDRAAAILGAIGRARPGDIVLVAGKGHETYQEIEGRRLPFDDAQLARELLPRMFVGGGCV